jgi:tetratricopeptide (TPR) repeat protein
MARKPLFAQASLAALLIACVLTRTFAQAQEQLPNSARPEAAQNPFATRDRPTRASAEARPPRGPAAYQNPFAGAMLPPIELPLRPGAISRWQRTTSDPDVVSPVANAFRSSTPYHAGASLVDPLAPVEDWDRLPPLEEMHALRVAQAAAIGITAASGAASAAAVSPNGANSGSPPSPRHPPDPAGYAHDPLVQPAWMLPGDESGADMPGTPIAPTRFDPFDVPDLRPRPADGGLLPVAAAGQEPMLAGDVPGVRKANGSQLALVVSEPELASVDARQLSTIASDYIDSSAGWYAQAEQAAHSADSLGALSAVAELCRRGLEIGPSAEEERSLRRLAAWAYNRRGELLVADDRPGEALADFQAAIGLDPSNSLAIHNRAVTLAQRNDAAAALRDFNRVIELNPGLAVVYRNRAELLSSIGRLEEAIADYDRALAQLPENAEIYRARGDAWRRLGDLDRALDNMNRAIRLAPRVPDAYAQRGNLAAERGDFEQAIRDFRQALALEPQLTEAHRGLAWLLSTCPDPQFRDAEQGLAAARRGMEFAAPDDCYMLDALAAAQANAGNFEAAAATLQQAMQSSPPEFGPVLRQRLTLYQQRQPFRNPPPDAGR